mgnify:CR=1 FL=1
MSNKLAKRKNESWVALRAKNFFLTPFRMTPERRRAWLRAHTLALPFVFLTTWFMGVWNPLATVGVYFAMTILPVLLIPSKKEDQ